MGKPLELTEESAGTLNSSEIFHKKSKELLQNNEVLKLDDRNFPFTPSCKSEGEAEGPEDPADASETWLGTDHSASLWRASWNQSVTFLGASKTAHSTYKPGGGSNN